MMAGRKEENVKIHEYGLVAQSGERQLCKLDVVGSNPIGSTRTRSLKIAYAQVGKCVGGG